MTSENHNRGAEWIKEDLISFLKKKLEQNFIGGDKYDCYLRVQHFVCDSMDKWSSETDSIGVKHDPNTGNFTNAQGEIIAHDMVSRKPKTSGQYADLVTGWGNIAQRSYSPPKDNPAMIELLPEVYDSRQISLTTMHYKVQELTKAINYLLKQLEEKI